MKKILILLIIPIFFGFRTGQEMDEKRMNRDLEIAKNILSTLIKSGSDSFFGGSSIEASYIKDYGVIFNIPEHLVYFHTGPKTLITIPEAPALPDFDMDMDVDVDIQKEHIEQQKELIEKEKKKIKQEKKKQEKIEQEIITEELNRARADAEIAVRDAQRSQIRQQARVAALAKTRAMREIYVSSGATSEIDWEEIMFTFLADWKSVV